MKLLVAIANHGTKSRPYLDRLLQEYRSMPYQTRIVVFSDAPKDLGADIEVRVGTPIPDPWSLPFGHKSLFVEELHHFDLFIYTEDDMLITQRNIDAFLRCCEVLPEDEIAGFMQSEESPEGRKTCCAAHYRHHWVPGSVLQRGDLKFGIFSNAHSACYILSRAHLKRAIESGGFDVPPHQERFDLLVTASTDPYTQCGLTKLMCLSMLDDFIVPHLPNKYAGKLGMDWAELKLQVDEMLADARNEDARRALVQTETGLPRAWLSKSYYEPLKNEILAAIPNDARSILSVGCGSGDSEKDLLEQGRRVFAIPLDRVIGAVARRKGIPLSEPSLEAAERELGEERFDCILCDRILHLWPEPPSLLRWMAGHLSSDGVLIVGVPNFNHYRLIWSRLRNRPGYRDLGNFERTGLQRVTRRRLRSWLKQAGLAGTQIIPLVPGEPTLTKRLARPVAEEFLATELVVCARRAPGNIAVASPTTEKLAAI